MFTLRNTTRFWVVTRPTPRSTMDDVLFETDIHGIARQFRGGLESDDIVLLTDDKELAEAQATKLLLRGPLPGTGYD